MDTDAVQRIRELHIPTVRRLGCAVQLACLECAVAYPCSAVLQLEERLRLERLVRRNSGRFSR